MTVSALPASPSHDADNAIIESALEILEHRIKQPIHYITAPAIPERF